MSTVPYVNETIEYEARSQFAIMMGVHEEDVPNSLLILWAEHKAMVNRLQPGAMDIRQMAILVQLDRVINGEKQQKQGNKSAAKAAAASTANY